MRYFRTFQQNISKQMKLRIKTTIPFCSQEATRQQLLLLLWLWCIRLVFSHHVGGEDEDSLVFTTRPLWVIQQIRVVLAKVPEIIPCHFHADNEGWVRFRISCISFFNKNIQLGPKVLGQWDRSSICTPTQSILRSNNHGVTDMWTLSFNSTTLPKIFGIKCLGITPSYRQRAIMVERLKYRLKMEEEYQTGRNSCHTKWRNYLN